MSTTPDLPPPAFRLIWRDGQYRVSAPNIGDTDCYTAELARTHADNCIRALTAEVEALKTEIATRNKSPSDRLHNVCRALEEDAGKSPFTREEWDRLDAENLALKTERDAALARAEKAEARAGSVPAAVTSWKLGEWFKAASVDDMQGFFRSRLPAIREAAQEHGYAIGVHGSERRDFDLMAMPWRDGASDADTLAHAIAMAAIGIARSGPYEWEAKPLGRTAVSIPMCWTQRHDVPSDGHIDLSVIAAPSTPPDEATSRAQFEAWARKRGYYTKRAAGKRMESQPQLDYEREDTGDAWTGWRAARTQGDAA